MCEYVVRSVAPVVWAGSATALRLVDNVDAWLAGRYLDSTLRPVLGRYAACDTHGTCDPTTHDTEIAARAWRCPNS